MGTLQRFPISTCSEFNLQVVGSGTGANNLKVELQTPTRGISGTLPLRPRPANSDLEQQEERHGRQQETAGGNL